MWSVGEVGCLIVLFILSVMDIREKKISIMFLLTAGIAGFIYHVMTGEINILLSVWGAVVGGIFLLVSRITNEKMGYGDGLTIMILGIYTGVWNILTVLSAAFFLVFCCVIFLACKKRKIYDFSIPFIPFLAGGYLSLMVMGG